ncbi:DUF4153 domain-containing protein [Marinobacter nanhaiticus D15-8W]|uniref:DUF4153 domain-containing protein n=1 Tax=Marinobacter nanhaiticus TaxID=1305740 RepID=UPI0003AA4912|nr:DUF4153 domain-containing protein [Marinobacter nanhaiticus]BES73178.1 DUF4153 domain-containing protein [Marinobacter nanhaiticus D15-8W]
MVSESQGGGGQGTLDTATRYSLILIALVQGWLLYFLHLSLDNELWPSTDRPWLLSIYSVVVGVPAFLYLGMERFRDWRNVIGVGALSLALSGLGSHLGWLLDTPGGGSSEIFEFGCSFLFSVGTSLFILAFYFRSWSANDRLKIRYSQLMEYSWQHALTIGMVGLFVGVFWLLLFLWAQLFDVIGIEYFSQLFSEPMFIYPVTALVGSLGLLLVRERIRLIATTRAVCEALIKALLPLAVLITVLFLAALPVTGMQAIWATGKSAFLMMTLTLIVLFFFNAVLSDDAERPAYPNWLRGWVVFGVLLLPINTGLAAWALGLRIEQYGLTVDRLWACALLLLIGAFTFSYALVILWRRLNALPAIRLANEWLALVVVAVLLMVNTPLADFRGWAAANQVDRLLTGAEAPEDFDLRYLRFELGAYGMEALESLKQSDFVANRPVLATRIEAVLKQEHRWQETPTVDAGDLAAVRSAIDVLPDGANVPDAILRRFVDDTSRCLTAEAGCALVQVDDGQWWGLSHQSETYLSGRVYELNEDAWDEIGTVSNNGCATGVIERSAMAQLRPVVGARFVYSDGACFYQIKPNVSYLEGLAR